MRLWVLSDLHLETIPFPDRFAPPRPDFDVLVAAGDMFEGDPPRAMRTVRRLAGDSEAVFVMGNHEHWCGEVDGNVEVARAAASAEGVRLLDRDEARIGGVRFLGCTLWSDFRLGGDLDPSTPTGEQVEAEHDGGSHLITIGDTRRLHARDLAWLESRLGEPVGGTTVVVTHHAPSPHCLPPKALGNWWAGISASDLTRLTDASAAALWAHGHVHRRVDLLRPGGTRIVCNPAGPGFASPGFDEGFVVEIPD